MSWRRHRDPDAGDYDNRHGREDHTEFARAPAAALAARLRRFGSRCGAQGLWSASPGP
jgi:hypothetical protein